MSNEDLKSKYGRGNSYNDQGKSTINNNDDLKSEENTQNERSNTYTKKTKENLTQEQKDIKQNIANVISRYAQEHKTFNNKQNNGVNKAQESAFVKIIKLIIVFCILITIVCLIIAFIAKPLIDAEGDQIIEQVKKSEDLYYSKMGKYHYFSKTNYDQTLGIDLSPYKYFVNFEVIPEETGNYEAKVYGATNAFTMTYYYLKSLMKEKNILE